MKCWFEAGGFMRGYIVTQIFNLLYRRVALGRAGITHEPAGYRAGCRIQFCDTAGRNPFVFGMPERRPPGPRREPQRGEIFVENATAPPKLHRSGIEDVAPTELGPFFISIYKDAAPTELGPFSISIYKDSAPTELRSARKKMPNPSGCNPALRSEDSSRACGLRISLADQNRSSRNLLRPGYEQALKLSRLLVSRWVLAACLILPFFSTPAGAADKLTADLIPLGLRTRTTAPIPVMVRFNWDGTRILEGRLEMEVREGMRVLGRYRSGDLALTTGEQKFRMLLPPLPSPYSDSQTDVQMRFVTARGVFDLVPSSLFMPTASERSLVIGWCSGPLGSELEIPGLERSLLFEQFAPPSSETFRKALTTSLARFEAEELPAQPLGYTSFDVVVLTAQAFNAARERQLQALARWVRGGGSVCVFVGGDLKPHHVAFLNELNEGASPPIFLAGDSGNLLPGPNKISCLHSGLGRSVIVTANFRPESDLISPGWRNAAAFLWKFRAGQIRGIAANGTWNLRADPSPGGPPRYSGPYRGPAPRDNSLAALQRFAVQPTELGAELLTQLMPRTVRLIPFTALIGTLALFVLMIGPVDFYLLGLLRRRRYTWLLFPATSIAFTIVTVLMANHYLGLRDQRHSLTVVDLDRNGTVLRWNRYTLIFAARDKASVTELKDALWSPLDYRVYDRQYSRYQPMEASGERAAPMYDGILPVHFQVMESVRQWRPELDRTFSFEPPTVPPAPNWRAIEEAWPDLQQIRRKLSTDKPFKGDVCAITANGNVNRDAESVGLIPPTTLLRLSAAESAGLFELVSRVSPTGGDNFEDAVGIDLDSNDSVLAIATQVGEDVVVYRRFFHGN